MSESADAHQPVRPSWDCSACGRPWPCAPAQLGLVTELDSVALAMYSWICLEEAAGDLPNAEPGELFQRFLAWRRPY